MYKYAVKRLYKVPAEDAGRELERIRTKYGVLKPKDVVEESKDDSSVLHSIFQWDNNKAADSWRIQQAADLIRNVIVTVDSKEVKCNVRAFVSVSESPFSVASYVPIDEALRNEYTRKQLLEDAKRDMASFSAKYRTLDELGGIIDQMDNFLKEQE